MKPHNFIFPAFTLASVGLVLVFWWFPGRAPWLASPWLGWGGGLAMGAAVGCGWQGWLAPRRAYDLWLLGSLGVWLASWLPIFSAEAPVFRAYPVYFVLLDAATGYFVLGHRPRWSVEERRLLAELAREWWFDSRLLAALVLLAVLLPKYYLLYPLTVGFLTFRVALAWALEFAP
ncbi:hypothetical protein JCM13664_18490 [Methylothermus subterraneus]